MNGIQQAFAGLDMSGAKDQRATTDAPTLSAAPRFSDHYVDGALGAAMEHCRDVLGEIRHDETRHIVSMGDWSTEHLIGHITDQCGPMHLTMATWSVSNDAVHRIADALRSGALLSLRALLDWRVKVRRPDALAVLRSALETADLRLDSCHAKVYLLANDDWKITVVGSPNLTTNPRIEASVLTEGAEVWRFHSNWMNAAIDGANPFDVPRPKKQRRRKR